MRTPPNCAACHSTASSPTYDNIAGGKYKGSRPLFVYIKKQHVGVVPGIDKFAAEYVSSKALGEDGYLAKKGLVTLPKAELETVRKNVTGMVPMQRRARKRPTARPNRTPHAGGRAARRGGRVAAVVRSRRGPSRIWLGRECGRWLSSISRSRAPDRGRLSVRPLASGSRGAQAEPLHSRPAYHGAFVAIAVLAPMLADLADRRSGRRPHRRDQALNAFDPSIAERRAAPRRRAARHRGGGRRPLFRRAHAGAAQCRRDLRLAALVDQSADPRHRAGLRAARHRVRTALPVGDASVPAIRSSASSRGCCSPRPAWRF